MKRRSGTGKISVKRILFTALNVLLAVAALLCFSAAFLLTGVLDAQETARRWRGDNPMEYSQMSCYLPVDGKLTKEQLYEFRQKLETGLHSAAVDIDNDSSLYVDAWSAVAKVSVSSALGKGDVSAIAVGGHFFTFHPLRLISGNYISEDDLMQDRVLLDQETAWLLFGGTDLQGMEMRINGSPFMVAGVVEREQDFASRKAYTSGMGIYMSYDALLSLDETAGVTCYELVCAQPVDGFVQSQVEENFPLGEGVSVENSKRFSLTSLLKVAGDFGERSMQTRGVIYPYWENAARYIEDWTALLLIAGMAFALTPVITVVVLFIKLLGRGKDKLTEDLLPRARDNVEEAVRVRQRRHWEKKHGKHQE